MTLLATPGDAASDSYGTVVEADAFFSIGSRQSAWGANNLNEKEELLKEATRILDMFFDWHGYVPSTSLQALRWPRTGALDADFRTIDPAVVPKLVKQATFELSFYILRNSGFDVSENTIDHLKVGPISLDFSKTAKKSSMPKIVIDMLRSVGAPNILQSNQVRTVKLERA